MNEVQFIQRFNEHLRSIYFAKFFDSNVTSEELTQIESFCQYCFSFNQEYLETPRGKSKTSYIERCQNPEHSNPPSCQSMVANLPST